MSVYNPYTADNVSDKGFYKCFDSSQSSRYRLY